MNFKTETKTFKTTTEFLKELKQLKFMPSSYNRTIRNSHVIKMMSSIREIGIARPIVVVVTKAFTGKTENTIGDGQHLTVAAINLEASGDLEAFKKNRNFTIMYVEIDDLEDIIRYVTLMNSTASNWKAEDYLEAWITFGNENYKFIKDKVEETGFTLNPLLEAYSGVNSKISSIFKNGAFVANHEIGESTFKFYRDCVEMGLYDSNKSFSALVRLVNANSNLDRKQFLLKIKEGKNSYGRRFPNRDSYLKMMYFDLKIRR